MWHQQLTKEQRIETLNQLALSTGYASFAIEKDWWVCMVLRAVFQSKYKDHIIFKGGTSLSKAYQIIERFSEDVDLIIDKKIIRICRRSRNQNANEETSEIGRKICNF